jgi:hypothetical protein
LNTKCTEDQFINIDKSHEGNQPCMNSTIKVARKVKEELQKRKKKWESKVMHCQNIRSMDRQFIGEEGTFLWLLR